MTGQHRRDLVVLAADKNMEATLTGLLSRHRAFQIRQITFTIYSHPGHDPGCRTHCHTFLRSFCNQFEHAIVVFDREGSGKDQTKAANLESELEDLLARNGWGDRAAVIVLDPELEIWVWSSSTAVDRIMNWSGRVPSLRKWLVDEEYISSPEEKPVRPKEAFRDALRLVRKQPSSSLFLQMAQRVSFERCTDRAFVKLKERLEGWFPKADP
jgi:hypothetical protein